MDQVPSRPALASSRRGFLGASAAGLVSAAVAGCTTGSPANPPGGAVAVDAAPVSFDTANAGGVVGWAGLAVLGVGQSNKLFVVDAKYHKVVTTIANEGDYQPRTDPSKYPNIRDSHAIVFTKDFRRMFTATRFTYGTSVVIEYDPLTLREVRRCEAGVGSHHIALTPDDRFLYAANQYGDTLSVIDTRTMTKVKEITVGAGPDYISPSMYWDGKAIDTDFLYVTVDGGKTLAVVDWRRNAVAKQIALPGSAHGVNLTPDGKHVWLAGLAFSEVWVLDNASHTIVKKLPIEGNPIHISISPDSRYAYITTADNLIFKVDTTSYKALWRSKGTVVPAHTGLTPDGKELWTLNHGMDTERYPYLLGGEPVEGVQVWETETGKLIAEIPMEAMPHEIQYVPYSAFGTPKPKQDIGTGGSTPTPTSSPTTTAG